MEIILLLYYVQTNYELIFISFSLSHLHSCGFVNQMTDSSTDALSAGAAIINY